MQLSDEDFIKFYQSIFLFLWYEDEDFMYILAGWPNGRHDIEWHTKALDAITRMSVSGLITSNNDVDYMLDILSKTIDDIEWMSFLFDLTEAGRTFFGQFDIPKGARSYDHLIPGFREALTRIFDEHGVGFDAELPYRMQF